MDIQESANGKETASNTGEGRPGPAAASGRVSLDRLELQHPWVNQAEEEQAEAALNRYVQAAREHMLGGAPQDSDNNTEETEEEREARSQRLKLQQKCQDIAALMMVDELEDEDLD